MDCIDVLKGEYCNNCKKCVDLKCEDCLFYDNHIGCESYKEKGECLFKYK